MVEVLLEWAARLLGLTARPRTGQLLTACAIFAVFALLTLELWGPAGLLVPAALLLLVGSAARDVAEARDSLWRAAHLRLDDPRQPKARASSLRAVGATAATLHHLGAAVDDARRARYDAATDALAPIDQSLLRAEEIRLVAAVRAMISLGLDPTRAAAEQAALAIPTGSEEIDAQLGRAVITSAWSEPERLRVIHADWENKGIAVDQSGTLARLHRLARLRIDARFLDDVGAAEARALSSEARAVGDEDFAADLEARAHGRAYR